MLRYYIVIVVVLVGASAGERKEFTAATTKDTQGSSVTKQPSASEDILYRAMQDFIKKSHHAAGSLTVVPEEELKKLYDNMLLALDNVMELMNDPANIYRFIENKGMETLILPNLHIYYVEMRTKLLSLLQLVFQTAPTSASAMAPAQLLDKLLDIFIEDVNLPLKSAVLDILTVWLPDNPRMQARVMKLKGLQPFYSQMEKLNPEDSLKLIKLFNNILKEHLNVRAEMLSETKRSRSWQIKANIYRSIGLVERLGTKNICMGLIQIYKSFWTYSVKDRAYMLPIFELMKTAQSSCEDLYVGEIKVAQFFEDLLKNLQVDALRSEYEALGVDMTGLEVVLERYIEKAASKDEL